ncbi:alpha-ketoacid dehydrogenase subunit beta [Clostridium magnum]|uniref:2-oxoisovalerate dehydrogenase subunit beta n=1 Tax=Clostridium magnum DSM 2767 TaxID=1121326 RepID=A0A162RBP1_9CLOT|nr:alpha-ketoacid dehydrogenase subunit beta [Clostridium magnum]KZL89674.1 2-oxoisovalerate dehydrogenase subunit beta [Clostridium magnum DSM 2767]SHH76026.1 pyruvate dehydrogenase E1 component beta subunit [Clostridium magnum DSM 2767]
MKTMTYMEALREAMRIKMKEDEKVLILGEDVGAFGGCFGLTAGLFDEFGDKRVKDTPISEGAIVGCAIGAAATGLKPIAEIMMGDFVTVAMDMLVNQAAKLRYMFGGKISLPMVVRLPGGAGLSAAAQHSQSLEAWLTHVPGIKVVYPSTPADAAGLLLTAIDDDNPVAFIEHKAMYGLKGEVPDDIKPIPFGVADIKREGNDVTIIATGKMVHEALKAAEQLSKDGIEVEVVDPRTLFPLDKETIFNSVNKTGKVVVVTEENKRGGYGGEISAMISEEIFDSLDAPVVRIGALNTPIPFAPNLESYVIPASKDIVNWVKGLF